ncbi:hypothetical protein [Dactylosporangium sp. CA-233914]|uniref:hypothetical protein n=1 Tax=Dactylosporangium sp. CA-233914 TaxID=3239934 RepID=UPI003D8DF6CD
MNAGRFDGDLQPWGTDQGAEYDRAIGALRALAAAYNARIARAGPSDDITQLRAARAQVVAQQRELAPGDHAAIARILAESPALLRDLRSPRP